MKKERGKLISVRVEDCPVHGPELAGLTTEDVDIERSTDGSVRLRDRNGSLVGYSRAYAANWDANFRPEPKPEDLN